MSLSFSHYTLRRKVFLSFLVLSLYLRGLLLHPITLIDTHSVELPYTRDRPVAEGCTCTKNNIHKRQTSMSPAGFEPTVLAT